MDEEVIFQKTIENKVNTNLLRIRDWRSIRNSTIDAHFHLKYEGDENYVPAASLRATVNTNRLIYSNIFSLSSTSYNGYTIYGVIVRGYHTILDYIGCHFYLSPLLGINMDTKEVLYAVMIPDMKSVTSRFNMWLELASSDIEVWANPAIEDFTGMGDVKHMFTQNRIPYILKDPTPYFKWIDINLPRTVSQKDIITSRVTSFILRKMNGGDTERVAISGNTTRVPNESSSQQESETSIFQQG